MTVLTSHVSKMWPTSDAGLGAFANLRNAGVISQFRVTIDASNRRVILENNPVFREANSFRKWVDPDKSRLPGFDATRFEGGWRTFIPPWPSPTKIFEGFWPERD